MGQDEASGAPGGKPRKRLPVELAELLTRPKEHALNHPLRREILRSLHRAKKPQTGTEMVAAVLPETSVSSINYHAAVLEGSDLVRVLDDQVPGEPFNRRYASSATEDVQILAILAATEVADRHYG